MNRKRECFTLKPNFTTKRNAKLKFSWEKMKRIFIFVWKNKSSMDFVKYVLLFWIINPSEGINTYRNYRNRTEKWESQIMFFSLAKIGGKMTLSTPSWWCEVNCDADFSYGLTHTHTHTRSAKISTHSTAGVTSGDVWWNKILMPFFRSFTLECADLSFSHTITIVWIFLKIFTDNSK